MKIAYLGPEGSYSHLAAQNFMAMENEGGYGWNECVPFRNFSEVFAAVETGNYGWYMQDVPVEPVVIETMEIVSE